MKGIAKIVVVLVWSLTFVGFTVKSGETDDTIPFPDVPRITKEKLKPMLGKPDVIILDVRLVNQWKVAKFKIPGAVNEGPDKVDSWFKKYPEDKTLVFY